MCGLAGVLALDGTPVGRETLARMADALRHRGPDADGFFEDAAAAPALGFAHRRLSIIDLSHAADCPVANEDGTVQVLLNGEIYNYQELRASLAGRHTFRSEGDTEAIAHLYEEKGEDAIAALDGMFAVALWDARRRRLLLARDAFGKKPLYYWCDERRLVFGSEIKALLAAGVPAAMDESRLGEYLAYGYVPTPHTLFRGVRKLPPASFLLADAAGVHPPRAYWDLRFPAVAPVVREEEATERVRELLTAAVRKRLMSDVPLGILLSGGVDSSAIAALTARMVPGRVKTFTVGFEGDSFFDERPHAEAVARHLGTEHHSAVLEPHAAGLMETLLHHHDEPFGDSSALPTYLVAREARKEVTVALNGDGGDETFAGYDRFHAALLADRLPAAVRHLLGGASRVLPGRSREQSFFGRARRFADKAARPLDERVFAWSTFFDLPLLETLDAGGVIDRDRILASYRDAFRAAGDTSLLSGLLYLNARTYLLDDLLPKMDRMTMAHGLEARSPLLDRPLAEYVATLPDALKRQGSRGKVVLKRAVRDLLPPSIVNRKKHGFGVPLGRWFRGELRPMVDDLLLTRPRLGRWLRDDGLRRMAADHAAERADHGHRLWVLLTLELWLRKHRIE
jgi:asparagine synthase (glutamine-hydrolysing)